MEQALAPRNFSAHAMETFREHLHAHQRSGAKDDLIETRMKEALYWLGRSIKFLGPINGEFLDRVDLRDDDVDYPRLPFDAICIEYEYEVRDVSAFDGVHRAAREEQPDRACVLAFYPDTSTTVGSIVNKAYGEATKGEFVVWPILGFKAGRTLYGTFSSQERWIPVLDPVLVTHEYRSPFSVDIRVVNSDKKIVVQVLACEESLIARAQTNGHLGYDTSLGAILKEMTNDAAAEALSVVELCNLLECTNVEAETWVAPDKLNRKRVSAGKIPFFDYKVLRIKTRARKSGQSEGGSHASPRLHYRRGHIRRIQSGKKTWVRPHMVGEAALGFAAKDYAPEPKV